jgi:hypothetical protein
MNKYSLSSGAGVVEGVDNTSANSREETGLIPQTIVTAYNTNYNSANQPASTAATLTITPGNAAGPASEKITYTYQ